MTYKEFDAHLDGLFNDIKAIRKVASLEYARGEDTFGNFNRIAARMNLTPAQVLLVYLEKHIDGLHAHFGDGFEMQREVPRGRILDSMLYLALLSGMAAQSEKEKDDKYAYPEGAPV